MKKILLSMILFIFTISIVSANTPNGTEINSAEIYQNVQDVGDIFVLVSYDLPARISTPSNVAVSNTDWCYYLANPTGCVTSTSTLRAVPNNAQSLAYGNLFLRLKDSTGNIKAEKSIDRITNSLAILKINSGHTITDFSNYEVCLQSGLTNEFGLIVDKCKSTQLSSSAIQNTGFGESVLNAVINIERNEILPTNTYIENQLITPLGQVLIIDSAYPNLFRVVPQIFQSGAKFDIKTFEEVGTSESALDKRYLDEAKTTNNFLNIEYLSQQYFGIEGTTFIALISALSGVIIASIVFMYTREYILTTIGFFIPLVASMQMASPISSYVLGALLIMLILTAIVFGRRWSN